MKRPCFGYFFNKYCCSLVSYRPLPNAKPVAGKKAGKNKLVLSSVSDLQTSNTIYSVGAKAWNSKNERFFLKKQIFSLSFVFVSCFLVLNFPRREFYVFLITGNTKVTGCWIFLDTRKKCFFFRWLLSWLLDGNVRCVCQQSDSGTSECKC